MVRPESKRSAGRLAPLWPQATMDIREDASPMVSGCV